MHRLVRPLVIFWLALGVCAAEGPKVFIVTDMEGVGGVNNADEQLLPGQRRYEETRRLLNGEVNAAVAGALEAGASEVVIWDGHDGSRSLAIDEIHPRARLIQGSDTPANYYLAEKLYDGIMFVGQHAMAGARDAVLAHSQSFNVKRITLNGSPVGEIAQVAAIAGHFSIPVIMLSGDQAACAEILAIQPEAVTVAVKRLAGSKSSLSLAHADAVRQIEQAADKAVRQIARYKPWKLAGPVVMTIEYADRTATYSGRNVLEAYQEWLGRL